MKTTHKSYPRPPEELIPEALAEWHRCMRGFYRYDFIGELDRGVLAAYCQCYGRWVAAETALKAAVDDSVAANLLIGIANTAMHSMVRFADKLGMTPLSRARILATRSAGAPIGKKEAQYRAALSTAAGRFGPAAPPRLVVSNDAINPEPIEPDFLDGHDLYCGPYVPLCLHAKIGQESE